MKEKEKKARVREGREEEKQVISNWIYEVIQNTVLKEIE